MKRKASKDKPWEELNLSVHKIYYKGHQKRRVIEVKESCGWCLRTLDGFLRRRESWGSLWCSRSRIRHCHCFGSGDCCGVGSIPGPGTSMFCGRGQKKGKQIKDGGSQDQSQMGEEIW